MYRLSSWILKNPSKLAEISKPSAPKKEEEERKIKNKQTNKKLGTSWQKKCQPEESIVSVLMTIKSHFKAKFFEWEKMIIQLKIYNKVIIYNPLYTIPKAYKKTIARNANMN